MKRIATFLSVATILWTVEMIWLTRQQPEVSTRLALMQVNGVVADATSLRQFELLKNGVTETTGALTLLAAIICFDSVIRRNAGIVMRSALRSGRRANLLTLLWPVALAFVGSGCIRAYDRPEYVEIDTSETGFLIPLEGDSTEQVKFQSEDYLKQHKVAAKRVQITHRWSQEGRWPTDGRWI